MTKFYDMGMYAFAQLKFTEVRQGLEEEREGIVIRKGRVSVHVAVYGERGMRDVGVRKGSNNCVAYENMGS